MRRITTLLLAVSMLVFGVPTSIAQDSRIGTKAAPGIGVGGDLSAEGQPTRVVEVGITEGKMSLTAAILAVLAVGGGAVALAVSSGSDATPATTTVTHH